MTLCVLFSAVLIAGGFFFAKLTSDLPSIEQLPILLDRQNGELLQPSQLMDRTGTQVLYTLENEGVVRKFLTVNPDESDHFSLQFIRLSVAWLEPDFWTSAGYDQSSLTDPNPHSIAERLARDLLIADEPDSLRSALRMRILANQIVSKYGRTQTLEWYLNSAYFGHLAYGTESASQLYLHKSASELDLAESVLMLSLIDSPALNPLDAPVAALENQQNLLKAFFDQGIINQEEYEASAHEKIILASAPDENLTTSTAFTKLAVDQLFNLVGSARALRGGLKVITSLDLDLQTQLICSSRSQLMQIESSSASGVIAGDVNCPAANYLPAQNFNSLGEDLSAGGVIMDPRSGQILAYSEPVDVGGNEIKASYQPGSLLSPFVSLTTFARGISPASLAWDVPSSLPSEIADQINPDGAFHGPVNYRSALTNDYLSPIAGLFNQYDSQTIWSIADAAGFSTLQEENPSAAILYGGGKTSMIEVARAYSIIAASGIENGLINPNTDKLEVVSILEVQTNSGQILVNNSQTQQRSIISSSLAYLMNNVLSDETARWASLGHPNVLEVGFPAAAKIGQVADKNQSWVVGYTPDRLVLIWIGNGSSTTEPVKIENSMAAGLWHALIQYSSKDLPKDSWQMPADVSEIRVCSPSGLLPTNDCPNITTDVFIFGNEPTQTDTLYQKVKINKETNLLATVFTKPELIEEKVFLNVPPSIRVWATNAGYAVVPLGYDALPMNTQNPLLQITSPAIYAPVRGKISITGFTNIDSFSSYTVQVGQGINPLTWNQIGGSTSQPLTNEVLADWDTSNLDGLYAIRLNVITRDNEIKTAIIQVTVDNQPPQIQITYPQADSKIEAIKGLITLSASVKDAVGISKVEWWMDEKKIGEQSDTPYSLPWVATIGHHQLQIKAWDTAGNQTTSDPIHFNVQN